VKEVAFKDNLAFSENVSFGQLIPDLEVFPPFVVFEKVNFFELMVNSLLVVPVIKSDELTIPMLEVDDSPSTHSDILIFIFIFIFYYFPIITIFASIQITELLLHFRVILH